MSDRLLAVLVGLILAVVPAAVPAQSAPAQSITIVVAAAPGGGTDILARSLAPKISEALGQSVIVENKPGASGIIGSAYVAHQAPADGRTMLLGSLGILVFNPALYSKLSYDASTDFIPVSLAGKFETVLVVNPKVLDVHDVRQLIRAARARPNGLLYASPGPGTIHNLAAQLFARQAGISVTPVQYRGAAPALQDLLGGHVPMMFLDSATAARYIGSKQLRILAVGATKRLPEFPNIPTVAESGVPGFEASAWQGFVVRAGTPPAIVRQLSAAIAHAIDDPAVREQLARTGINPATSTPAEFEKLIRADTAKWGEVIKKAHIKVE